MKTSTLAFCAISLLVATAASAQWGSCSQGPTGAICYQPNVGIGSNGDARWPLTLGGTLVISIPANTPTPYYPFVVWANGGNATLMQLQVTSTTAELQSYVNLRISDGGGTSRIYFPSYVGDAYFTQLGNVGIGTQTPDSLLTVAPQSGAARLAVGTHNGADADGRLLMTYDPASDIAAINAYHSGYKTLDVDGSPLRLNKNSAGQVQYGNGGLTGTGPLSMALPGSTGTLTWLAFNGGNAVAQMLTTSEFKSFVPITLRDGGENEHVHLTNYGGDVWFTNLGNFGIGTSTPNSLLTVAAPSGLTRMVVGRNTGSDLDGRLLLSYDTVNAAAGINAYANGYRPLTVDASLVNMNANSNGQVVVGPGGAHATDRFTVNGDIYVTGNVNAKYQDVAEWVPATEAMAPGTVVVVNADARNTVAPSDHAYDTRVAGVVSAQPGFILGEEAPSKERIATTGRVKVRVSAAAGAIRAGDLLVTSDRSGVAMRSEPIDVSGVKIHRPGTLIGKALEPLETGEGEVLVLLSLQ